LPFIYLSAKNHQLYTKMTEQENHTKDLKFYSQRAIAIATFIGGPLAAGYLIRENYLTLNKPEEGKKSLIIGIVSTIVLFVVIFMIPEGIIDKIPNQIFPLVYTGIVFMIVDKIQGKTLNQHKEHKNHFFSGWKAAGIGLVSFVIISIGIIGYVFLSPDGAEYVKYEAEIEKFSKNEAETLTFYDHLDTKTNYSLLQELDNSIIPKWEENIKIIKASDNIENLPSELLQQNKMLLEYSELRLKAFQLFKKAISEDSEKYNQDLEQLHLEIDRQLDKLN